MVYDGFSRILAPLEDPLEEGEVHIEEGSEEDAADLKHATDIQSPSADQVERHRVSHYPPGHGATTVSWAAAWADHT